MPPTQQAERVHEPLAGLVATCARPELISQAVRDAYQDVVASWPLLDQQPVVYHDAYNITFFGIEKLHPFDSCKYRRVVEALARKKCVRADQLVAPLEASREILADVHSADYLQAIHTSAVKVAEVTELAPLALLPSRLCNARVVSPMKRHVAGTMLAAALAVERGWAINVGGGMHHAHHAGGGGWCPFDDITLAVRRLRRATAGAVKKVLYIDLDVHQGNGVARDKLHFNDTDLILMDAFNCQIYPRDTTAENALDFAVRLKSGTSDESYLAQVTAALQQVADAHPPGSIDLVVYNAGTDILAGDPLGRLDVSPEGVVARDRLVWEWAGRTARAPLLHLLSGGYAKNSAGVIANSLTTILPALE